MSERLLIHNIPPGTTQPLLDEFLSEYAKLVSLTLLAEPKETGSALVQTETEDEADHVVVHLNGLDWDGYKLVVTKMED